MKKYSLGNHIGYLLKGIWKSDRRLMALLIIETVCSVITPYIAMYLPKIGVDLATDGASVRRAAALPSFTIPSLISVVADHGPQSTLISFACSYLSCHSVLSTCS